MRKVSEITVKVAHISGTLKKVAKSLLESPRDSWRLFLPSETLSQVSDTFRNDYNCHIVGARYTQVELSISQIKSR